MIRLLLALPVLVILVAFALSNQQVVRLGLWPTDIQVDAPLSIAVLVAAGVFFIMGALMTWTASLSAAGRARRAERTVRHLETQAAAQRAQPTARAGTGLVTLPPPGA